MAIKCGDHRHETVAQVRACQLGGSVATKTVAPGVERLARQAGIERDASRPNPWAQPESEYVNYANVRGLEHLATGQSKPVAQAAPVATSPAKVAFKTTPANEASPKQVSYIQSLLESKEVEEAQRAVITSLIADGEMTKKAASRTIDLLVKLPRKAAHTPAQVELPEVPAGRYALRTDGVVKFYVLDRPTEGRWAGYVFLKAQASDDKYPIRNPQAKQEILARIAEDVEGAQRLYGQELGRCYACGRTLTDETSRSLGIGPDCRNK